MAGPASVTAQKKEGKADDLSANAFLALEEQGVELSRLEVVQGKQGGSISGKGGFSLKGDTPSFSFETTVKDFNLQPYTGTETSISGNIEAAGTIADYEGSFAIENEAEDWQSFSASGTFNGDRTRATLRDLTADWLGGNLTGRAMVDWGKGTSIRANLEARGLDPELIDETWSGDINADTALQLNIPPGGDREVTVNEKPLRSTFRGRPVRGSIAARLEDGQLTLKNLDLQGKGFDIQASGALAKRITFDADVSDLSALLPGSRGELSSKGWVRYRDSRLALSISGNGKDIAYGDVQGGTVRLSGRLEEEEKRLLDGEIVAGNVSYNEIAVRRLALAVSGALSGHDIELAAVGAKGKISSKAYARGGYEQGVWKGTIVRLQGSDPGRGAWSLDSPAGLLVSGERLRLEALTLESVGGERLQAQIDLGLQPLDGSVALRWSRLNPSRFEPLIPVEVNGSTTGGLLLRWDKGELRTLKGQAGYSGIVRRGEAVLTVSEGRVTIDWTGKGLKTDWRVGIAEGGSLRGTITSPVSPHLTVPDEADFAASWEQVNLALINPMLGEEELVLQGACSGEVRGRLGGGEKFSLAFKSSVQRGAAIMTVDGRRTTVPLQPASSPLNGKVRTSRAR